MSLSKIIDQLATELAGVTPDGRLLLPSGLPEEPLHKKERGLLERARRQIAVARRDRVVNLLQVFADEVKESYR